MPTEKENMLSGKPFKAFDKELSKERTYARELVFDFNNLRPGEYAAKNELLKKLIGDRKSVV